MRDRLPPAARAPPAAARPGAPGPGRRPGTLSPPPLAAQGRRVVPAARRHAPGAVTAHGSGRPRDRTRQDRPTGEWWRGIPTTVLAHSSRPATATATNRT